MVLHLRQDVTFSSSPVSVIALYLIMPISPSFFEYPFG
jgi:hypothetical protein